jgi:HD-GYP domain-containing protein (c-di-GMP phosphodiesterase class II)
MQGRPKVLRKPDDLPDPLVPLMEEAFARCIAARHVIVVEKRQSGMPVRQALASPVLYEDAVSYVILIGHDASSGPDADLKSMDPQIVESLTLMCGDWLRNLRLVTAMRQMSIDVVRALISMVDQKDPYTAGHSTRVGYYAKRLGWEIGFDAEQLQTLEWAALLHDVGKIGIRDDVLNKNGKLTEAEFNHVKTHPVRSSEVVSQIPQLVTALAGVTHHHEHYDGSGYPNGLAGEAIPLQARVIQVADVFDALTTSRSYRDAFHWSKALEIMNCEAGTTLDPELVKIFDRQIRAMTESNPNIIERIRATGGLEGEAIPPNPAHDPWTDPAAAAAGQSNNSKEREP